MKRATVLTAILALAISSIAVSVAAGQATTAIADKPALLTSIGQSADLEMVKVLLSRAKIPFTTDPARQGLRPARHAQRHSSCRSGAVPRGLVRPASAPTTKSPGRRR